VTPTAATTTQAQGLADALALWRARGVTAFDATPAPGAPVLRLEFQSAAAIFHGLYDDQAGVIYINDDLTEPATISIVVAHELGHAFGLFHVPASERLSVMNPGNLAIAPTAEDQRAVEALWGACR